MGVRFWGAKPAGKLEGAFLSGHRAIDDLPSYKTARRLVEREMVRHYTNQKGEHRICGGKDLKSSQAYPRGFLGTIDLFGNLLLQYSSVGMH